MNTTPSENEGSITITYDQLDALVYFNQARAERAIISTIHHRMNGELEAAWEQCTRMEMNVYRVFGRVPGDDWIERLMNRYRSPKDRIKTTGDQP